MDSKLYDSLAKTLGILNDQYMDGLLKTNQFITEKDKLFESYDSSVKEAFYAEVTKRYEARTQIQKDNGQSFKAPAAKKKKL